MTAFSLLGELRPGQLWLSIGEHIAIIVLSVRAGQHGPGGAGDRVWDVMWHELTPTGRRGKRITVPESGILQPHQSIHNRLWRLASDAR